MPFQLAKVEDIYAADPKINKAQIKMLMEWISKQPHLPKLTELDIILFFQACRYSSEAAKTAIDNYFTIRTICADMYRNRNVKNDPLLKVTIDTTLLTFLPNKTPDGYTAVLIKMLDPNPDFYYFSQQAKFVDMAMSSFLHQNGPCKGIHLIMDMEGGQLAHLAKASLAQIKKQLFYVQEAVPLKIVGIHYINVVSFMDKIMALMRPFMKKELTALLNIHSKIETLYKFVPLEMLPSDYGGQCDSISVLHEKMKDLFRDSLDFFNKEDAQIVDESKRQGPPKNDSTMFGIEGSFKKLEVD